MMSLRKKTVHGIAWQGFTQVSSQGLQTIVNIILARLLVPADFGLIGMVTVITGFIGIINRLGLSGTIIYKKDVEERHLSSIYWFSQLEGLVLFGLGLLVASYVAHFYNQPALRPIFMYLSFGFVISSLTSVHLSLLDKNLRFKSLVFPNVSQIAVMGIITVVLASRGYGVWSLVYGSLASGLYNVLMIWKISTWRPKLIFDIRAVGEILGYGVKVMAQQVVNYFGSNVDFFIVGKVLGASPLGLYNLAFGLTSYPQSNIVQLVNRVTFPSFSQVQDDDMKLRAGYLELVKYLSLITYPIVFGLFILAPEFIKVVYTAKWSGAILPVQILCVGAIAALTSSPSGSLFLAKGRAGYVAKLSLIRLVLLAASVYVGSKFGIVGVAVGVSAFFILFNSYFVGIANRMIDLKMQHFLKSVSPSILASALMVAVLGALRLINEHIIHFADKWFLLVAVILGVVVYFLLLRVINKQVFGDIKRLYYEFRPSWFSLAFLKSRLVKQ